MEGGLVIARSIAHGDQRRGDTEGMADDTGGQRRCPPGPAHLGYVAHRTTALGVRRVLSLIFSRGVARGAKYRLAMPVEPLRKNGGPVKSQVAAGVVLAAGTRNA